MKKGLIIFFSLIIVGIGIFFGTKKVLKYIEEERIRNAIIKVTLVDDLNIPYESDIKISDLITSINGTILDDKKINTTSLGKKEIKFHFINEEDIKVPYSFEIEIIDNIKPIIWLSSSYTVNVGSKVDLLDVIMCGDNLDDNPKKEIIGEYDFNTIGNYDLVYRATDASGNISEQNFTLKVIKKQSSSSDVTKISFSTLYDKYKNDNTKIGLDVSKWQGDINFQKVKNAGVEFVFIKLGGTDGIGGDYYLDSKFERNIKGFTEVGIPVGLYFYSYADSIEKAKEDAKWVIEQIKDYDIDLPIAFDWENWSKFNRFKMSFKKLTDSAESFINTLNDAGYSGMLYSSNNYLEKIWLKNDFPTWLAHYTSETNYKGNYEFWQMTSSCVIDGITGNTVDVDVWYY